MSGECKPLAVLVVITLRLGHGEGQVLTVGAGRELQSGAEFVRLGRSDEALQVMVVAADRRQRQALDRAARPLDGDIGPQALGMARQAQAHALALRRVDDLQEATRQLADIRKGSGA